MEERYINNILDNVNEALKWKQNVQLPKQSEYLQSIFKLRRNIKQIQFTSKEKSSVAAFGESQMGKSYLIGAILSSNNQQFMVTDGNKEYNFIEDINPSTDNSQREATGVVTRFTINKKNTPKGYLETQLLSIADIVLIMCEAFYHQLMYSDKNIRDKEYINTVLHSIECSKNAIKKDFISEDDIIDIKEYITSGTLAKSCTNILHSEIFDFLLHNINYLSLEQLKRIFKLFWNEEEHISKVFDDLMKCHEKLNFSQVVYSEFISVLKDNGSLLDVDRLDEMYVGDRKSLNVKVISQTEPISVEKSFFSALIAELTFVIDSDCIPEDEKVRTFLKYVDILDFPGARRPEEVKIDNIDDHQLSLIIRRGKVSYLFNKYSSSKRISSLLFCQNQNDSKSSGMGYVLDDWVKKNVGETVKDRNEYVRQISLSPLFIISTWFNCDLVCESVDAPNNEKHKKDRWIGRFETVLENQVLKSNGKKDHWFNNWTSEGEAFRNIYLLRDFKFSDKIFEGWNPKGNIGEQRERENKQYKNFLTDLRQSFLDCDFVKEHFVDPVKSWDYAATIGNDGTKLIIEDLNKIAKNISNARENKLQKDILSVLKEFVNLLFEYYHPEDKTEKLKLVKRQIRNTIIELNKAQAKDEYFFSNLLNSMMVSEADIHHIVFDVIKVNNTVKPMANNIGTLIINAKLDRNVSFKENIDRLCEYFICEEDELQECLQEEGLTIDDIKALSPLQTNKANDVVVSVEKFWFETFLQGYCVNKYKDTFKAISLVTTNLWSLYKMLDVHDTLYNKVKFYIEHIQGDNCINLISDFLAMQLNNFVNSFGYKFFPKDRLDSILNNLKNINIPIDIESKTSYTEPKKEVSLLELLPEKNDSLTEKYRYRQDIVLKFPRYSKPMMWQQYLKLGYIYAIDMPEYNVKANAELGNIIENLKQLI